MDIPSTCHICRLMLVSSPHLARSYHHLFPINPYEELSPQTLLSVHVSPCLCIVLPRSATLDEHRKLAPNCESSRPFLHHHLQLVKYAFRYTYRTARRLLSKYIGAMSARQRQYDIRQMSVASVLCSRLFPFDPNHEINSLCSSSDFKASLPGAG